LEDAQRGRMRRRRRQTGTCRRLALLVERGEVGEMRY
jgi:hypothetical protein